MAYCAYVQQHEMCMADVVGDHGHSVCSRCLVPLLQASQVISKQQHQLAWFDDVKVCDLSIGNVSYASCWLQASLERMHPANVFLGRDHQSSTCTFLNKQSKFRNRI